MNYLSLVTFGVTSEYCFQINWNTKMIADPAVSVHYLTPEIHAKYWETRNAGAVNYDLLL